MCTHSSLLKFMKETDLIREVAELYCKSLHYYLIALIVVSFLCFLQNLHDREKCGDIQGLEFTFCRFLISLHNFEETWFLYCYCVKWIIALVSKQNFEFTKNFNSFIFCVILLHLKCSFLRFSHFLDFLFLQLLRLAFQSFSKGRFCELWEIISVYFLSDFLCDAFMRVKFAVQTEIRILRFLYHTIVLQKCTSWLLLWELYHKINSDYLAICFNFSILEI